MIHLSGTKVQYNYGELHVNIMYVMGFTFFHDSLCSL